MDSFLKMTPRVACSADHADCTSGGVTPTAVLRTRLLQLHPALAKQMPMQRPQTSSLENVAVRDTRPASVSDGGAALAQLRHLQTAGQELLDAGQVCHGDSLPLPLVPRVADNAVVLSFVA